MMCFFHSRPLVLRDHQNLKFVQSSLQSRTWSVSHALDPQQCSKFLSLDQLGEIQRLGRCQLVQPWRPTYIKNLASPLKLDFHTHSQELCLYSLKGG